MSDVEFIFGGSFDPIHFGHLHIIDCLQTLCAGWPIRVLPCSTPALKKQASASFLQRVEMIHLALRDYKNIIIDQREGAREGKSYSYDTLLELRDEYPTRRFILAIGSDNLDYIGKWYQVNQLAKYCHLIVVNRPGFSVEQQQAQLNTIGFDQSLEISLLTSQLSGLFYYYKIIEKETSSTFIRKNISMRKNTITSDLSENQQDMILTKLKDKNKSQKIAMPAVVKDYIKHNSIYW